MLSVPAAKNPVVLSYRALRRIVGAIALLLPFAVSIPAYFLDGHRLASSISGYYYFHTRNLFVGSLCAIAVAMIGCTGYDWRDEWAGKFAALCALGVAFFPTAKAGPIWRQPIALTHAIFATSLFLTLAVFCLYLFRLTAANVTITPEKIQRNRVYKACGCVILLALLIILVSAVRDWPPIGKLAWNFLGETTALLSFGVAWMIKGETLLQDAVPRHSPTQTSDNVFATFSPAASATPPLSI